MLEQELRDLLNKHSVENRSNTPDFILARFMLQSLSAFNNAVVSREQWYGRTGSSVKANDGESNAKVNAA